MQDIKELLVNKLKKIETKPTRKLNKNQELAKEICNKDYSSFGIIMAVIKRIGYQHAFINWQEAKTKEKAAHYFVAMSRKKNNPQCIL